MNDGPLLPERPQQVLDLLYRQVQLNPGHLALISFKKTILSFLGALGGPLAGKQETLTFREFWERIYWTQQAYRAAGMTPGQRVLVMITPGQEFAINVFALFAQGAIPVFIDPGMGLEPMLQCIETAAPSALIGIPKIHHLRLMKKKYFSSIEVALVVEGVALGATSLCQLVQKEQVKHRQQINPAGVEDFHRWSVDRGEETAAILFTSGGTGPAKGVQYTHRMFLEQALALKKMFAITAFDRDYPCFPLFGLFSMVMGATVYMPKESLLRPAQVDAKSLTKSLLKHRISFSTGSPALWEQVAEYAKRKKISFPQLRAIVMFGAPVGRELHQKLLAILPHGDTFTPYGATECLPVSCISGREILCETSFQTLKGAGTCVGHPVGTAQVQIRSFGDPVVGDIWVKSPTRSPAYLGLEIPQDQEGWYCMGDVGRLDEWGRLWFLGRKSHVLKAAGQFVFTEEFEPMANAHPAVKRSALVALSEDEIVLVVERRDGRVDLPQREKQLFFQELQELLRKTKKYSLLKEIRLERDFPVDTRHNIKIDRQKLAHSLKSFSDQLPLSLLRSP